MSEKFDVTLEIGVRVVKQTPDGKGQGAEKWYDENARLSYTGMDYLQVTATNAAVAKFGVFLADLGFEAAEQLKGFPAEMVNATRDKFKSPM